MDLPEDIYTVLFQHLQKREHQAVASMAKKVRQISKNTQDFSLESETVTAFYEGYHMTGYQHKMLNHLLLRGPSAQYRCIPDTYNLAVITVLFAAKTKQAVSFSSEDLGELLTKTLQAEPVLLRLLKTTEKKRWGIPPIVASQVKVGETELYLGDPSRNLEKIHPEYVNVPRYPVWVSAQAVKNIKLLPPGRIGYIKDLNKIIEMDFARGKKKKEEWQTMAALEKFDVFFLTPRGLSNPGVYNIYALLTQLRTKKPKMLIINNSPVFGDYTDLLAAGCIPLPLKFLRELPESNIKTPDLDPMVRLQGLCYAELLILEYYTDDNEGDLDIDWRVKPVMEWLKDTCGRAPSLRIRNPRDVFRKNGERTIEMIAGPLVVDYISPKGKGYDNTRQWVLVDPSQEIDDQLEVSLQTPPK